MAQAHIVATLGNVNRDPKSQAHKVQDFLLFREADQQPAESTNAVLLADPKAQSQLIKSMVFGMKEK